MKYLYLALLTSFSVNFLKTTDKNSNSKLIIEFTCQNAKSTKSDLIQILDYKKQVHDFFIAHENTPIAKDLTTYLEEKFPDKTIFEVLPQIPLSDFLPILYNHRILIKQKFLPNPWRYALYYYKENNKQNHKQYEQSSFDSNFDISNEHEDFL